MLKSAVKASVARLGYEIRRKPATSPVPADALAAERSYPRDAVPAALRHVRSPGWRPQSVIDVGAAQGNFGSTCARVFPEAHYLLAEPLRQHQASLDATLTQLRSAILAQVAVGAADGWATLNVRVDWEGSSLYRETEGPHVDGQPITVPMETLDTLCREHSLAGPYLLKINVQGAELDVLAGGVTTLAQSDYVILEVSFFQFHIGRAQLHDVMAFMLQHGFVVYDILGFVCRPVDNALCQMDLAFVKVDCRFRREHVHASPAQRAEHTALYQRMQQAQATTERWPDAG